MKKAHFREISFDLHTPLSAYCALATPGACILENSQKKERYSFIGVDPLAVLSGEGDYAAALREFKAQNLVSVDHLHPLALYAGGCIGYVTYDQEYFFQIYRSGAVFDHHARQAFLFTVGEEEKLGYLYQKLIEEKPCINSHSSLHIGAIAVDKCDKTYMAMVEQAKEHLRAGDIFQIVLSRTFYAPFAGDPFQFYCKLRTMSPAPYLFFFNLGECAIAGASPEKIVSIQGREIESMPIAGTRPKGSSFSELLNDPKEAAEHVMLVDLARNDVGAVSIPGSVKVAEFKAVHPFSHVNHLVSRVTGELDPKYDALDAFKASFPAGTLSGAPKCKAMELIDKIENSKRGLYGGAILVLDAKGNLTSCIAIRTGLFKEGILSVRAGAGIVIDSDPSKEAAETFLKANTVLEAAKCF